MIKKVKIETIKVDYLCHNCFIPVVDVKVYIESCLSRNNVIGMQYCLDRLMESRNPPCSNKTSTGEIATGVGVGIVGGHLIKGLFK